MQIFFKWRKKQDGWLLRNTEVDPWLPHTCTHIYTCTCTHTNTLVHTHKESWYSSICSSERSELTFEQGHWRIVFQSDTLANWSAFQYWISIFFKVLLLSRFLKWYSLYQCALKILRDSKLISALLAGLFYSSSALPYLLLFCCGLQVLVSTL